MDGSILPGDVLVDLYIRLRRQVGSHDCNLDPNYEGRAFIAMAILSAEAELGANIWGIEAQVRETLGLAGPMRTAA